MALGSLVFGMSCPDLLLLVQPVEGQEGEGWRGAPTFSCTTAETSDLHQPQGLQTKGEGFHAFYVPLRWYPTWDYLFHFLNCPPLSFFSFSFNKSKVPDYLQGSISNTKTLPEKKTASINTGVLLSFRQWLLKLLIFTHLTYYLWHEVPFLPPETKTYSTWSGQDKRRFYLGMALFLKSNFVDHIWSDFRPKNKRAAHWWSIDSAGCEAVKDAAAWRRRHDWGRREGPWVTSWEPNFLWSFHSFSLFPAQITQCLLRASVSSPALWKGVRVSLAPLEL